jgi:hypothetical protein
MPDVIALKDGRIETLFEVRHFEELVDRYMGSEAERYLRNLIEQHEEEISAMQKARREVENYTLRVMLPKISVSDDVREAWAEKFLAKVEDVYGLEE